MVLTRRSVLAATLAAASVARTGATRGENGSPGVQHQESVMVTSGSAGLLLGPRDVDLARALPPWPADDSLAGRADLETVHAVQAARSPADVSEARSDAELGAIEWATRAPASPFDADRQPLAAALLAQIRAEMAPYAHRSPHLIRPRPAELDSTVTPVIVYNHGSYPSARTASTRVWAEVLADLFPESRTTWLARARRSAWLRVVGGAHYPTDLAGGQLLAESIMAVLRAHRDYPRRVNAARREIVHSRRSAIDVSCRHCDAAACRLQRLPGLSLRCRVA